MEQFASIDELTGVLMRRAFMARASVLLREAPEKGKPLSIAILDIDKFKAVNDGFGHAVGDRILRHVTSVVSARLRSCDLFGVWVERSSRSCSWTQAWPTQRR
jgi:diguanylate cyclase (GGDEF)-like protein